MAKAYSQNFLPSYELTLNSLCSNYHSCHHLSVLYYQHLDLEIVYHIQVCMVVIPLFSLINTSPSLWKICELWFMKVPDVKLDHQLTTDLPNLWHFLLNSSVSLTSHYDTFPLLHEGYWLHVCFGMEYSLQSFHKSEFQCSIYQLYMCDRHQAWLREHSILACHNWYRLCLDECFWFI